MAYLIDSDVFLQAKNLHYGFDICPGFWRWLEAENAAGRVFSVEKVAGELQSAGDELSDWVTARGSDFFLAADAPLVPALATVAAWATSGKFDPTAASTFLQVADYYLVAFALAHGHTVVTHEKPAATVKKIKIPNACIENGVPCMTPFEMLRRERARFVLAKSA